MNPRKYFRMMKVLKWDDRPSPVFFLVISENRIWKWKSKIIHYKNYLSKSKCVVFRQINHHSLGLSNLRNITQKYKHFRIFIISSELKAFIGMRTILSTFFEVFKCIFKPYCGDRRYWLRLANVFNAKASSSSHWSVGSRTLWVTTCTNSSVAWR